jgi:cyclophilin family peptidyl-prolyl cis-trans isomerase
VNLSEENSSLDEQGFTVFGMIVEGQNVVDRIAEFPTEENPLLPGEQSFPRFDIVMDRVRRVSP